MSALLVFDATGSMAGNPFEACLAHAESVHPPETAALLEIGGGIVRTTLGRARHDAGTSRGGHSGASLTPSMLRECALAHGDVKYYTDGFMPASDGCTIPEGRLTVLLHGSPSANIARQVEDILTGCRVVLI